MTASTDKLPEFEGVIPAYATMKFSGTATGFDQGLKVAPVVLHNGDRVRFVIEAEVRGVDHPVDKDEQTFRRHDLRIVEMAPVSDEIATAALREYAQQIEEIKNALDGQAQLFAEQEAAEREAADDTDSPGEIAAAAAARAKGR